MYYSKYAYLSLHPSHWPVNVIMNHGWGGGWGYRSLGERWREGRKGWESEGEEEEAGRERGKEGSRQLGREGGREGEEAGRQVSR